MSLFQLNMEFFLLNYLSCILLTDRDQIKKHIMVQVFNLFSKLACTLIQSCYHKQVNLHNLTNK